MNISENLKKIEKEIAHLDIVESLRYFAIKYPEKATFSTSLSYEDQVVSHFILINKLPIEIFTLDTGRLFSETYSVLSRTNEKYNTKIKVYFPNTTRTEQLLNEKGPMSFYESVENRKECCFIRKVEPLKRALNGKSIWITGIRAEHSENRQQMPIVEWDEGNKMIKFHPLRDWTFDEIRDFVKKNDIPFNPLHEKGFVSIGCAPCTRAVRNNEDFRAGRWWWEDTNKKECGLHVH